jgi:biotin carboxylase
MNNWIPPKAPLIILGAGPQQLPVYEVAKRLGIKTLAVDFNPNAEARNLSDFFVLASVRDSDECIRGLEATGLNFSGVITCGVEVSPQVSRIALHFGLQGIPEEVAIKTTHKGLRLQALYDGKIPIPDFRRLNRAEVPDLDFPFVVKPSDSSGSRGVQQVTNKEEFQQAFSEAASISSDGEVIAESFESGIEISIEGFALNGHMTVTGIAERHFYPSEETFPEFLEYGGTMPPSFSKDSIQEAEKVFADAAHALGIIEGPSKGDLILTPEGVKVLEITSRSSPGFAALMQPLASGVEVLEVLVRWAVNAPILGDLLTPKWDKAISHRYYRHNPGKVRFIEGLKEINRQPGVEYVLRLNDLKVGDVLEPMNYMNRLLYVITVASTPQDAIQLADSALASIKIEVDPLI